jgi:hypothetical protein
MKSELAGTFIEKCVACDSDQLNLLLDLDNRLKIQMVM